MLISLNWLQELLEGDAPLDADAVAKQLTALGLEVEGVTHYGRLPGIVVGEVKDVAPHPNADKLRVVQLDDGQGVHNVVCGAPNVPAPGGKVAFAQVGCVMPEGFEISPRKLRGVESSGMICAEAELQIGPDDDGILILPDDAPVGMALADYIPTIADTVIEISVTPNRPDALGHLGVARDLAPALGRTLRVPVGLDAATLEALPLRSEMVEIEASGANACGRYLGFALEGASVGPSPVWARVRLHRVDLRPISNVVDITNLCLMEFGQPMHAFDLDALEGERVRVRAGRGEALQTLDDRTIEAGGEDLVIADASKPAALAGVMGGSVSSVETGAQRLLLEVAYFQPGSVRATAKRHGFHTDSSHRFERGVDWGFGLEAAARRALKLLMDFAGAKVVARAEARSEAALPARPTIELDPAKVGRLLGMEVAADEAARILEAIEIEVDASRVPWRCRVPTHRPDLGLDVDLIEEVMRFHGLEHLEAKAVPRVESHGAGARSHGWRDAILDAVEEAGFHETVGFAFTDPAYLDPSGPEAVWVDNPLRQQSGVMRTHMLPSLLDAVKLNTARHHRALALFELGRVYAWENDVSGAEATAEVDRRLPVERDRVALIWADEVGLRSASSMVAATAGILRRLGIEVSAHNARDYVHPSSATADAHRRAAAWTLHPGVHAWLRSADGRVVGMVGEVHPDRVEAWDLARPCTLHYAELFVDEFPEPRVTGAEEIPRFPSSARDLSLEARVDLPVSAVVEALRLAAAGGGEGASEDGVRLSAGDRSRSAIEFVEDYRGQGVPEQRRAILFRLHYRAPDRSVTDDEVRALHDAIVERCLVTLRANDPDIRVR